MHKTMRHNEPNGNAGELMSELNKASEMMLFTSLIVIGEIKNISKKYLHICIFFAYMEWCYLFFI